jgi:regulatory protein
VSAYTTALRLLGRREQTTAELTNKLLDRDFAAPDVEDAIVRLRDAGALDDRRAALAHIRTASRIKGRGRRRIERELMARGVDRALVHELLGAAPPDQDEAALRAVLQRKHIPARLDQASYRRVFQQLLRRGFSPDLIAKVIGRSRRSGAADEAE